MKSRIKTILFYIFALLCLFCLLLLICIRRLPALVTTFHSPLPRVKPNITSEKDVYLCSILRGRVGNAFFNYMSILGIAKANNMTLLLKDESVLPEVIANPPKAAKDFDEKCWDALYVPQRRCCVFDESLVQLKHDDRYIIYSCLITWKYFKNIEPEVRSLLAFRLDVLSLARSIITRIRDMTAVNTTLVGMHVRRGDQSGFIASWNGHNPVTSQYISRAMKYFSDRFSPVHFLVASQDTSWCRKYVSRDRNDVTIMEDNSPAVDIAVLTLTDHMIVSIGTYGWWAGYLNPGIKTYMKDFIRPNTDFANSFDDVNAADYIYPGWVGL